ncbi:MAG: hypothetical protein ACT4NV_16890 [Rhodoferax sp.]
MPIHIAWEAHGAVGVARGCVAALELIEAWQQLQNDLRFDDLRYIILDYSALDGAQLTEPEYGVLASTMVGAAYANPHIRVAIVGTSAPARTLAQHSLQSSPYLCRCFGTLEQARGWIAQGEMAPVPLDIQLQAPVPDLPAVALRY